MDEQAQQPPRSDTTKVVIAIIAGAVIVAGAIVFVTRGPDECDEWNDRVLATFREFEAVQDAPAGSLSEAEVSELRSRARQTIASAPQDCEIRDDVAEQVRKIGP